MNWNISHDGRVTQLDDGPRYPWWWNDEPEEGDGTADQPPCDPEPTQR